jgi:heme-degrading monooxygenase HmoA
MFARSTTIIADPLLIDRGVALVRDEVMPALMRIDGCVGMSCLVERESGRCISTSSWRSAQAMRASEAEVGAQRNRMIDVFGAGKPLVQQWEIPVMHRAQPAPEGAFARLTWLEVDPDDMEASVEELKAFMPDLDELPGFRSASLLINRATGQMVSTTVYESFRAAEQNRDAGQELRRRFAEQTNAGVVEVAEFELALARLRVPELV